MPSDDFHLKAAFAAFLHKKPGDPFDAAMRVFPEEKQRGHALWVAMNWPDDAEVISELERLKTDPSADAGLSRDDLLDELTLIVTVPSMRFSGKDIIAAARLIAEIKGHIVKEPKVAVSTTFTAQQPTYKVVNK